MIMAGENANSADFFEEWNWKVGFALLNRVAGTKALRLPVALAACSEIEFPRLHRRDWVINANRVLSSRKGTVRLTRR